MRLKMKIRSQRYNIDRPRSRNLHKYNKYKMHLGIMIVIYIKQHLSTIHEKVKQHWGWVEKKCCLWKKACSSNSDSLPDPKKLAWEILAQPANNLAKFIQLTIWTKTEVLAKCSKRKKVLI